MPGELVPIGYGTTPCYEQGHWRRMLRSVELGLKFLIVMNKPLCEKKTIVDCRAYAYMWMTT
jgi:hypothetical protein